MKKISAFLASGLIFMFSCRNEDKSRKEQQEGEVQHKVEEVDKLDSPPYNAQYNEQTQQLELKYNKENKANLNESAIIEAINRKYPKIKLEVQGHKQNTIILKIENPEYLTEQMGSAGSQTYFAEVTFSLTELPDIKAVQFEFEEGEHASPGIYTREDFRDFN